MKTCQITFRSSKKLRFIKGESYTVLPQVGYKGIKFFKIFHANGQSFSTDENHLNKFFA